MESYLCLKLLGGAEEHWCGRKLQLFTGLRDEGDDKWSDMVVVTQGYNHCKLNFRTSQDLKPSG
jgi:hypothetical protein